MAEILVTKPGVLNQRDKAELRKSGIVVVEARSPADVKLISTDRGEIASSDMLYAALSAITHSDNAKKAFADMCAKIVAAEFGRKNGGAA